MVRRLIINGDDLGLHSKIDAGIVAAWRSGCLTSTSVMAGGASFAEAVRLVRSCRGLSIGVHLTLVATRPVARENIDTLLTSDRMLCADYGVFVKRYLAGRIDKKQIKRELASQVQAVADAGIQITHFDSHQHLHVLPGMVDIVARIASDFGITRIRIPSEPIAYWRRAPRKMGRFCGKTMLTLCARMARKQYEARGLRATDHFFGMMAGGSMNQATLLHILDRLPDGTTEIMVHPGANTEALTKVFSWRYHWQEELDALRSEAVRAKIRDCGISLIGYDAL